MAGREALPVDVPDPGGQFDAGGIVGQPRIRREIPSGAVGRCESKPNLCRRVLCVASLGEKRLGSGGALRAPPSIGSGARGQNTEQREQRQLRRIGASGKKHSR